MLDNIAIGRTDRRRANIARAYRRLFGAIQNRAALRQLRSRDLEAVFRAADTMSFYDPSVSSIHDMRLDLEELVSRGIVKPYQLKSFYGALFSARMFGAMREFYAKWHGSVALPAPFVVAQHDGGVELRRVLAIASPGRRLIVHELHLNAGVRLLVIAEPKCHFTENAIDAIQRNASLNALMGKYSSWIAPVDRNMDFDVFVSWNRAHPDESLSIAYSNHAWPHVKVWSAPVFLFFASGKLRDKIIGWHGHSTIVELRSEFAKLLGGT